MAAGNDLEFDTGRTDPPTDRTRDAARLTAARYAKDAGELRLFLAELGLDDHDAKPVCGDCGGPMSRIGPGGYHIHTAGGMCIRCNNRARETEKRAGRRARAVDL